jgi:polyphenol oxidase
VSGPALIFAPALELPGLRHAFFTRAGGVSKGVYASLNGGVGSQDAAAAVAENRARMAAALGRIVAALGPCIAQESYEVGPEFVAAFAVDADAPRCFAASANAGRAMFDLHGYIGLRAARAGVGSFVDLGLDTYADEARFFSYRRKTHRGEADYGRLVSAIALA